MFRGTLTPAATARKPRSGFCVRPRRGVLPVLVMWINSMSQLLAASVDIVSIRLALQFGHVIFDFSCSSISVTRAYLALKPHNAYGSGSAVSASGGRRERTARTYYVA